MPITANITNEQITASVGETQIDVSVSGGVGPTGSGGAAATISVGTVTTGAAGSSASVTNVGTSSAAVLNFTIPAGATGATGPQGATGPAGTTTWVGITDKPTFAAVATSGSASDLSTGTLSASRLPSSVVQRIGLGQQAQVGTLSIVATTTFDNPQDASLLYVMHDAATVFSVYANGLVSCSALALGGTDLATTLAGKASVSHAHSAADVTSGTFDIARIPTGTSSTTVSLGNHTHSQLHDRSHAITSSSDHTATAWRAFYSNGSGVITELALGAAATVLTSNGASAAPTFSALPAGGTKSIIRFYPGDNQPPASNFATLDTRNSVIVLEFDAATDESAVFVGYIPEGATLTNGLKVRLSWMADTATSGNVRWGVQFEADGTDLDADSFDTATLVTSAANGTSGIETVAEITATAIDSLAAGDRFRLKVYRDADDATNDTMTGDAQLVAVEVQVA